jgi:hypothetical protein
MSTDSQATFHPQAIPFLKSLVQANKLVAQVTPYNASPVTAIFDTTGLGNAIKPLRETCNWAEREATERAAQVEREAAAELAEPRAELSGSTLRLTGTDWRTTSFKRLYEVYADGVLVASVESAIPPTFELNAANVERLNAVTVITVDTSSMMNGRKASTKSRFVKLK